jgi:hypothetical protein
MDFTVGAYRVIDDDTSEAEVRQFLEKVKARRNDERGKDAKSQSVGPKSG